jgi:CheY-like chemotaxis protein
MYNNFASSIMRESSGDIHPSDLAIYLLPAHEPLEPIQSYTPGQQEEQAVNVRRNILVVEDDTELADLEADILAAHGYHVATVASGELAISSLHQTIPDLIILDLELLGGVQGWEVLQTLRTMTAIPVLITSSSSFEVRAHLQVHGETRSTLDHLPKPYSMQMLLKRIKRMLPIIPS